MKKIKFTGGFWEYFGYSILLLLLSIITFGLALPYLVYWSMKYFFTKLEIDGNPVIFTGSFGEYFGYSILLMLLSIITFGLAIPFWAYWSFQYFFTKMEVGEVDYSEKPINKPKSNKSYDIDDLINILGFNFFTELKNLEPDKVEDIEYEDDVSAKEYSFKLRPPIKKVFGYLKFKNIDDGDHHNYIFMQRFLHKASGSNLKIIHDKISELYDHKDIFPQNIATIIDDNKDENEDILDFNYQQQFISPDGIMPNVNFNVNSKSGINMTLVADEKNKVK